MPAMKQRVTVINSTKPSRVEESRMAESRAVSFEQFKSPARDNWLGFYYWTTD